MPASLGTDVREELDRKGFVLVPGFLDQNEIEQGQANLRRYFPTPEEFFASAPERYSWLQKGPFSGLLDFPFVDDALNDHATAPPLIDFCAGAIGCEDIRLVSCFVWAKYSGNVKYGQKLHMDFPNHMLAYPREGGMFREVIAFIYYNDITLDSGPTFMLSREHTADLPYDTIGLDPVEHAGLYEHEVPATGPAGTILIYTPATFHRAGEMGPPPASRFIAGVSYRAAGCDWIGRQTWALSGNNPSLWRFMTRASVKQRGVLGLPPPGHPYWDERTIAGVGSRYDGIDMTPYWEAFHGRPA